MRLPTITDDVIALDPGDEIILRHRTWDDYEDLLARRQDQAGLRIYYSSNTQEIRIMSPLPEHGKDANLLANFVRVLLEHQRKEWEAYTPITLKFPPLQGVEPDYCYYIQNRDQILGKRRIDLTIDPPPDLVIEVDLTSITKPSDYQSIKAAELWIYRWSQLLIYEFDGQGYQETLTSPQFPKIAVKTLIPQYCDRGWQVGSSVAIREFAQCLEQSAD
ncbi:MAG: Uma2 family endonuclease [Leptolyngbyaceae cyanobacterium bins.349]|nr:Uma2 family endonuclease [Leptolyngbyaceae cyanobacterium bins.349]